MGSSIRFTGTSPRPSKIQQMTLAQLRATLDQSSPPTNLQPLLAALWWEAKGDWNQAHEIAQAEESADAAWVHAYLHRKEGDTSNAGYWYRQARQQQCTMPLEKEWEQIVSALLNSSTANRH
jgi:hypothetical protein